MHSIETLDRFAAYAMHAIISNATKGGIAEQSFAAWGQSVAETAYRYAHYMAEERHRLRREQNESIQRNSNP